MALDEETLERMLAAGKNTRNVERPPSKLLDATEEFEVYERADGEEGDTPPPADESGADVYPPAAHAPPPGAAPATPTPASPPAPEAATPVAPPAMQPPAAPPIPAAPQAPVAPPAPTPPAPAPPAAPTPAPSAPATPAAPARPQVYARPTASAPASRTPSRDRAMPNIAVLQADYNSSITDVMAQWAEYQAKERGATIVHHIHVPGVYDVPLMAKTLAARSDVDAVVVLGAVIQGETGHDELITREAARLLADLAYTSEKPIGLGIAGPRMTMDQAAARVQMGKNAVESVILQYEALRGLSA